MMSWKLTTRAVNSKPLMEEVHEFVSTGMDETGVNWSSDSQRSSYVDMLNDFMQELVNENKIEQWNVQCDGRNNKASDMNNGRYVLDVFYKQRHCLNTTHLHYVVDEDDILEPDLNF